ncbi:GDNF family receptor alpha-2 [Bagarius yarrelli]|uniref:GDNF family receptor alpha-2 n=1 Tax=Bagarius yarrelli TaxID=175774 RepID=A0A556VWX0_BAGYA|nr:GDNF family receptor alpha-2 [Bagarius yarrelli]
MLFQMSITERTRNVRLQRERGINEEINEDVVLLLSGKAEQKPNDLFVSLSSSLSTSSSSSSSLSPEFVDCVRASEDCNLSPQCSSRYRIMRQCLVGKDWNSMLSNKECQAALEVLQETPLVECRCKRGMKKELQCLQNYWSPPQWVSVKVR